MKRYVATVQTEIGPILLNEDKLEGLCKQCENLPGMTGYKVNDTKMHNWQVARYDKFVAPKNIKSQAEKEAAATTVKPLY